jgi:hypothetical protein
VNHEINGGRLGVTETQKEKPQAPVREGILRRSIYNRTASAHDALVGGETSIPTTSSEPLNKNKTSWPQNPKPKSPLPKKPHRRKSPPARKSNYTSGCLSRGPAGERQTFL